jgi:hypothetical protein
MNMTRIRSGARPASHVSALLILLTGLLSARVHADVDQLPEYTVWDTTVPFPGPDALPTPAGIRRTVLHRAGTDRYNFLHDVAVTEFQGTLFAAWYNCPEGEMEEASVIRGRRSTDHGDTWSEVEVIAEDTAKKGIMYVPIAFGQHDGRLFGFISNMVGPDLVTDCEVFEYQAQATPKWISRARLGAPFPAQQRGGSVAGRELSAGRARSRCARHQTRDARGGNLRWCGPHGSLGDRAAPAGQTPARRQGIALPGDYRARGRRRTPRLRAE